MITDKIDYKSAYESVLIANDMLRKENDRLKQEIKEIKDKLNCDLKWAFRYDELFSENNELHSKIEKAYEILKLCNSQCAKETIKILKDSDVDGRE